jgi:amino acid permease
MLICTVIMTVSAFIIMLATCSQFPGAEEVYYFDDYTAMFHDFPMKAGFQRVFGNAAPSWIGAVLSFPALILSPICFLFAGARQFSAISASRLLPYNFSTGWWRRKAAVPMFSVLCFIILAVLLWTQNSSDVFTDCIGGLLFSVAEICTCSLYILILIGFCMFKAEYGTYQGLKPLVRNPFGVVGAFYAMGVFTLVLVDQLYFYRLDDSYDNCKVFGGIVVASLLYYYSFARKMQTYSDEEKSTLLKVYTIRGRWPLKGKR